MKVQAIAPPGKVQSAPDAGAAKLRLGRYWGLVFGLALLLYLATLAPDLVWQDQGEFQYYSARLLLSRPGDVVRVHPLYIVTAHYLGRLGQATHLFGFAYAANLTSAFFMALAAANITALVLLLTRQRGAALLAGGLFALTHTAWFNATQAQTYSMALAAVTGMLALLPGYLAGGRRHLWLLAFVGGLGISAHMMTQIAFAVIMLWLLGRVLRGRLAWASYLGLIGAWTVGAMLLWLAIHIEYQRTGDLPGTLLSAVFGRWKEAVFNLGRLGYLGKRSLLFFGLNFPTPLVLLALPGIRYSFTRMGNRPMAGLLLAGTLMYALFAVRYDVPNQNNFFLPMYALVAIYVGIGAAYISQDHPKAWMAAAAVALLALPLTYLGLSELARNRIDLGTKRHIPYRDEYQYYLRPWQQGQQGPRRLVRELFAKLPPGAVIMADSTPYFPLQYAHEVEGQRLDLRILDIGELTWADARALKCRVFTLSSQPGYYPRWVEEGCYLHDFPLAGGERVYEITWPGE